MLYSHYVMKYLSPKKKISREFHRLRSLVKKHRKSKNSKSDHSDAICTPEIMDLSDNYKSTVQFIDKINHNFIQNGDVGRINFKKLKKISPTASLVLIAEIYRCWKSTGNKIAQVGRINSNLAKQLNEMGFFSLLDYNSKNRVQGNTKVNILPSGKKYIKFKTGNDCDGEVAEELKKTIFDAAEIDENHKIDLYKGITESMVNVTNHAYKKDFVSHVLYPFNEKYGNWWMSGTVDNVNNSILIQFYDHGAGIPRTILTKKLDKFKFGIGVLLKKGLTLNNVVKDLRYSDADLIELATQMTKTTTKEGNRGKGLPQIIDVIKTINNGRIRIMSYKGEYTIHEDDRREKKIKELPLRGTLIQWRITKNDRN